MTVKLKIKNHNKYKKTEIKQFILFLNDLFLFFKYLKKIAVIYYFLYN